MLANVLVSVLGIALQILVFVAVYGWASRGRKRSLALAYGALAGVYGYALFISLGMFLSVPWWTVNALGATVAGAMVISSRVREHLGTAIGELRTLLIESKWSLVPVAVVVTLACFFAGLESDLSIDGQLYHGPVLAEIFQSGTLWAWTPPNQYAYYTDLTMAGGVNFAGLGGDARFDNAIQIPHLLLLCLLIVWALGERVDSRVARVALATTFITAPVVWLQARILYVDLAYGAALAAAVLIVCIVKPLRRLDILMAGVAIAGVIATKPAGLFAGAIIGAVLVLRVLAGWGCEANLLARAKSLAVLVWPLLASIVFYARNYLRFENPVYPVSADYGPVSFPGIIDMGVFASGERGNGFLDPGRVVTFVETIVVGMLNGVTKPDYDPRWGGFGRAPWVAAIVVLASIVVFVVSKKSTTVRSFDPKWLITPLSLILVSAVILAVQPATFDTRYVIGPTAVLMVAAVLALPWKMAPVVSGLAAILGLIGTVYQVAWTEKVAYTGGNTVFAIMDGPQEWRPNAPASLSGHAGPHLSWLPEECVTIGLETSGGVKPWGLEETSYLATLAYGLYGDHLCNDVVPMTLEDDVLDTATLQSADYLVVYARNAEAWLEQLGQDAECFSTVAIVEGSESYPEDIEVLTDGCR